MIDESKSIPEDGIFLVDAFVYVFRTMSPNWRELEESACQPHLHGEERPENLRIADAKYDRAQLEANKWLRDRIRGRSITPLIIYGPNGQVRQITCDGWENVGFAENGISENFVGPDDLMNPGPDTTIDGVRYPVFFRREAFEKLVEAEFGPPPSSGEPLEPGAVEMLPEPPEPELLEPKASPTPTTASKIARCHQVERAERHIARLYPDGTNEISSEVIRKKLEKDPVLLAELAEQGGKPPSRGSIDRARGLRR